MIRLITTTLALIALPVTAQAQTPLATTAEEAFSNANRKGTGYLSPSAKENPQLVEAFAFADRAVHFCPVIMTAKDPVREIDRWVKLNGYSHADTLRMTTACRAWVNGYAAGMNK